MNQRVDIGMEKRKKETDLREIWKVYSTGLIRFGGRIRRYSEGRNIGLLDPCLKSLKMNDGVQ